MEGGSGLPLGGGPRRLRPPDHGWHTALTRDAADRDPERWSAVPERDPLDRGVLAMAFFPDDAEVDTYIGGVFRAANDHPESGPKLRASGIFLKVFYTDPATEMNVVMREPAIDVSLGATEEKPDITLMMKADTGDKFWRGEYNLAVGLAKGEVKAKGPV